MADFFGATSGSQTENISLNTSTGSPNTPASQGAKGAALPGTGVLQIGSLGGISGATSKPTPSATDVSSDGKHHTGAMSPRLP